MTVTVKLGPVDLLAPTVAHLFASTEELCGPQPSVSWLPLVNPTISMVAAVTILTKPTICSGAPGHTATFVTYQDPTRHQFWSMKLVEVCSEFRRINY
jgi:hypothetical protein